MKALAIIALSVLAVIILAVGGCAAVMVMGYANFTDHGLVRVTSGQTMTDSQTIKLQGAETVRAEVTMGAGDLRIAGGADDLLNAAFTYNVPEWRPEVRYDVSGRQGILEVNQPKSGFVNVEGGKTTYEWDLRFADEVPIDLRAKLGAGTSNVDLRGLTLSRLNVETGVGDVTVDLRGNYQRDFDAQIKGGIGNTKVLLPKGVGVTVAVKQGLGNIEVVGLKHGGAGYVNDAYDTAETVLRISVESGLGQIRLVAE
jgi:hypothetical protein